MERDDLPDSAVMTRPPSGANPDDVYSRPLAATGSRIAAALKLTSSGGRRQVGQFIKDAAHALSESLGVCSSGLCATETANLGAPQLCSLGRAGFVATIAVDHG